MKCCCVISAHVCTFCMLSLISEVLRLPFANLSLSRLATDSSPALGCRGESFSPGRKKGKSKIVSLNCDVNGHFLLLKQNGFPQRVSRTGRSLTGFVLVGDGEGAGPAENHQIQQRVGAQSVGAVDTGAGRLAAGIQTANHLVCSVLVCDDLEEEALNTEPQRRRKRVSLHCRQPVPCSLWECHPCCNERWAGRGSAPL